MSLLHPGLEAFIAVVKTGTVHAAAKRIGMGQTGVTQRIRTLEKSIETTLFTRSRKGMILTEEGEALFRYCQKAVDLEGELYASIKRDSFAPNIHLDITGPSSFMRARVIPNSSQVLSIFPNLTFTYHITDSSSGIKYLKSGISQMAIVARNEVGNELDSKLLAPEKYILVATEKWKDRSIEEIVRQERIIDFNPEDELSFKFLRKFQLFHFVEKERHFANNIDALTSMILLGRGYSVLTYEFAQKHLESGELIDLLPGSIISSDYALAWYPRTEMASYFRKVIEAIN